MNTTKDMILSLLSKPIKLGLSPSPLMKAPSEALSKKQLEKADAFFEKHKEELIKRINEAKKFDVYYPPTLQEDKNNPYLWKTEHWVWYELKR